MNGTDREAKFKYQHFKQKRVSALNCHILFPDAPISYQGYRFSSKETNIPDCLSLFRKELKIIDAFIIKGKGYYKCNAMQFGMQSDSQILSICTGDGTADDKRGKIRWESITKNNIKGHGENRSSSSVKIG